MSKIIYFLVKNNLPDSYLNNMPFLVSCPKLFARFLSDEDSVKRLFRHIKKSGTKLQIILHLCKLFFSLREFLSFRHPLRYPSIPKVTHRSPKGHPKVSHRSGICKAKVTHRSLEISKIYFFLPLFLTFIFFHRNIW